MKKYRSFPAILPEIKFILNCAKYPEIDYEKLKNYCDFNLNWDLVIHFSMLHLLFPLVYKTIIDFKDISVPQYVTITLEQPYKQNVIASINMASETVRVNNIMEKNGIQLVILKGAPLANKLYGDITLRPSGDIDIWVEPKDFLKSENILTQLKYKRYSPDPSQEKVFLKNFKHFEYYNSERVIPLELHWRAINPDVARFPDLSGLKTQQVGILENQVHIMADEEWLIYLIIHGCNHMWSQLRWLIDIGRLMQNELDWNKVIYLAEDNEVKKMVHLTVILLRELLEIPIPTPLIQSVAQDQTARKIACIVMNRMSYNENKIKPYRLLYLKNVLQVNDYHLSLRTGWKRKLSYIIRKLRPNNYDFNLFSLPDSLSWLYYIIRPFYWLKRRLF